MTTPRQLHGRLEGITYRGSPYGVGSLEKSQPHGISLDTQDRIPLVGLSSMRRLHALTDGTRRHLQHRHQIRTLVLSHTDTLPSRTTPNHQPKTPTVPCQGGVV